MVKGVTTSGAVTKKLKVKNCILDTNAVSGSLKGSGGANILCNYRLKVTLTDGTVLYLPLYVTTV